MKTWLQLALAAGLGLAIACGGSSSDAQTEIEDRVQTEVEAAKGDAKGADQPAAGAPRVSETYQRTINRGWEEALAGETPAFACAGLKGRVMATGEAPDAAASEALFACNVLLPVRYFETFLEQVDAGEKTCHDFMMAMSTQLSAMTLSIESVEAMAGAMDEGGEAAAAGTVAAAIDAATMEQGLTDPKRLVKERLAEPVGRTCPDLAPVLLR